MGRDVCKYSMDNNRGQRCLTGHIVNTVGGCKDGMYDKLLSFINQKFGKNYAFICHFNDRNTGQVCADVWNECFALEVMKNMG